MSVFCLCRATISLCYMSFYCATASIHSFFNDYCRISTRFNDYCIRMNTYVRIRVLKLKTSFGTSVFLFEFENTDAIPNALRRSRRYFSGYNLISADNYLPQGLLSSLRLSYKKRRAMKIKREVKAELKCEVKAESKCEIKAEFTKEVVKEEVRAKVLSNGKNKVKVEKPIGGSPFPDFNRPYEEDCRQVVEALTALHGVKEIQNSIRPVLDALIRTILSQNTTDKTSMVAFQNLKRVCPTWKDCLAADDSVIEEAIRFGGLAEIKVSEML